MVGEVIHNFRFSIITVMAGIFLNGIACHSSIYYNPDRSHHTKSGFRNPNPNFENHGFGALLKWTSTRWLNQVSTNPQDYKIETIPNDGSEVREFRGKWSVTWIGHATTLVQMNGFNILTDPIWSERCSPVSWAGPKRYTQPGIDLDNLPKIDAIIISHNHYDHMDLATIRSIQKKYPAMVFVGLGNKDFLESEGIVNVAEMDWWDEYSLIKLGKNLDITFTPTQHFSARGILDRDRTLWGSFALVTDRTKIYFAGDTGYFDGFKEIGEKWSGFDLAILPIGAYEPRWFMSPVHTSPEQSVQAFEDLNAEFMLPMHYNTFVLSDEALDEPLELTRSIFQTKSLDEKKLLGLKIGESFFRN